MSRQRYLTAARRQELEAALSDRDLNVLSFVASLRFVSGAQLARLCFPGVDARTVRRSLLRLVELGAIERLPRSVGGVRSGSAGFIYHLGLGGQHVATSRGWLPPRRRRRGMTPGSLFVRHTLQVAELHTRLTEAARDERFELLELTAEPASWRPTLDQPLLKPDSYVRLGSGPFEDSFFIEVDRGTEGSRALERQLGLYIAYHASGREQARFGVFPKTLWLTPDERRAEVIEDCIERLPMDAQALFAVAPFDDALALMTTNSDP